MITKSPQLQPSKNISFQAALQISRKKFQQFEIFVQNNMILYKRYQVQLQLLKNRKNYMEKHQNQLNFVDLQSIKMTSKKSVSKTRKIQQQSTQYVLPTQISLKSIPVKYNSQSQNPDLLSPAISFAFEQQYPKKIEQEHDRYRNNIIKKHPSCSNLTLTVIDYAQAQRQILPAFAALIYTINYISFKIDSNQTYDCNYVSFHIMNLYMQAQMLTLFRKNQKQSLNYLLFQSSLKKLNTLKKIKPQFLPENQCDDIITDCLKYYRHTFQEKHYLRQLDRFIAKHQTLIGSFMPLFHTYFITIAQFQTLFPQASVSLAFSYLENIPISIRQKYNLLDY